MWYALERVRRHYLKKEKENSLEALGVIPQSPTAVVFEFSICVAGQRAFKI